MKYLLLAIALSFLLLVGIAYTLTEEISQLKARDRLHSEEIMANRTYIALVDDKTDRIVGEVREIVNIPYSQFIPIDKGWLAIRKEVIK